MAGLEGLKAFIEKFIVGGGKKQIFNADLDTLSRAILQIPGSMQAPNIVWVDATRIEVKAKADSPASVMMCGFPNILQPGGFVSGGLTDGYFRQNVADVAMDFDTPANLWGTGKHNQLYVIYALAAGVDTVFTLKAMPLMRFSSQAAQVISIGRQNTPANGIGYGFVTDELANAKIYVLNGASAGLLRTIAHNNNDNGTAGTITYSGDALTMSEGDWFVVLPNTNFRFLGSIVTGGTGHIEPFRKSGGFVAWDSPPYITNEIEAIYGYGPLAGKVYYAGTESGIMLVALANFCDFSGGDFVCIGYEYLAGFGLG